MPLLTVLLAVVGVLGVSASGPLMAAIAAPAVAIAFWRNAMASAVLLPVTATTRRQAVGRLSRADLTAIGFAGVMLALHFLTWTASVKLTSVASATALVCLQIGWIVLFERLRGVRPPTSALVGVSIAFAGVVVVSGVDLQVSTEALLGDLLALVGGMFAALYTMAGGHVRRTVDTTTYTSLCYATCAVVLLAVALLSGQQLLGFDSRTWVGLVALTVAAQLLGHSVFNHLLAVMSPMLVSLVLLLEVPGAALLAGVFLDQAPGAGVYVGLVLVLAGLVVVVTRRERAPAVAPVD